MSEKISLDSSETHFIFFILIIDKYFSSGK